MSDKIRRAVRTFLQAATAAIAGLSILVAADVITGSQAAKVGAVLTALIAVVSAAWNGYEDSTGNTILVSKHSDPDL